MEVMNIGPKPEARFHFLHSHLLEVNFYLIGVNERETDTNDLADTLACEGMGVCSSRLRLGIERVA
jgi:hypothetical protein